MLVSEANRLKQAGGGLYFVGLKDQVYENISKNMIVSKIGNRNFFDHKTKAIKQIYKRLDQDICKQCPVRIFNECDW